MGFGEVPCIKCGEKMSVRVFLSDGIISCAECDADWEVDDVREMVGAWTKVLAWLDTMPATEEE